FPMSSSAPRRSLRIRNGNVPDGEEKQEPDKVDAKPAAPKRRAAAIAADGEVAAASNPAAAAAAKPVKKAAKANKKEQEDEEQGDADDDQKMETVEGKEEESSKESEEEKAPTPAKRGRKMRDRKKNATRAEKKEDEVGVEEEEKPTATGGRPKRKSMLAATQAIKKVVDNKKSASSDLDDDFDIKEERENVETRKKERKRVLTKTAPTLNGQKKVEQKTTRKAKSKKNRSESEEEDTVTEDEEMEEEEEKPKKRQRKTVDAKSAPKKSEKKEKEDGMQRPPTDRPHEKVRLLLNKKYKVDRDEMLAWEKRSVHMARKLRVLEEEKNRGTGRMKEVMDKVYEFVARCLKDRTRELGAQESVRLCHVLQDEFDEDERKKKMTITQRIKETVENEKKELHKQAEESDEHGEDEDEWEDMETVDGEGEVKTVQVHVENRNMATHWKSKWLKQEVNRAMRTRYENAHKAHLVSYMSHLRHLAAMALSPSSKHGEIPLIAIAMSMLPEKLKKTERKDKLGKRIRLRDIDDDNSKTAKEKKKEKEAEKEHEDEWMKRIDLVEWWWNEFGESERLMQSRGSPNLSDPMYSDDDEGEEDKEKREKKSEEERMSEAMMKRRYRSHKEAALMFFALATVAGYSVRLVCRCEVVSKKVPEALEVLKQREEEEKQRVKDEMKNKNNKNSKKKAPRTKTVVEEHREFPIVSYWIEMWDDVDEQWLTVDVIRPTPPRKGFEAVDEEEYWELRHQEPLNSSMEKDGKVLYVLAIDNEWGLRDVSARYIHSTNFVAKEFRQRRANLEWTNELWEMEPFRSHFVRSRMEDDDWLTSMKVEMPAQVGLFKDHPLYVLDKDVLKMQRIFPYDVKPVGEIRGYKVYNRMFLRPTKPAKWYEKMGRQVRDDEPPVGEKKLTNPLTGESVMQGLFGYWQTDPWKAGEVIDGKVPRNEFDNIYMYQPEMCPKGGIHLIPNGLQRVAFDLGKDFVQAVIGWMYKGGNIVPIVEGAVFAKSDLPDILAAWKECEKRWKEEEQKIRSERSLTSWKRLIKGMLRLAAMRKEFEPIENKKKNKGTKLGDDAVRAEEAAAWPQQRYGGDMFE
ncbi:hypothetical protein PFISCL1PPCAC_2958, partial [Pristionchus fissidentatus]